MPSCNASQPKLTLSGAGSRPRGMGSIARGTEVCACAQTAFAMGRVQVRGDTSAWTDTPQEKLLRLQRGYEASALQAPAPTGMTWVHQTTAEPCVLHQVLMSGSATGSALSAAGVCRLHKMQILQMVLGGMAAA